MINYQAVVESIWLFPELLVFQNKDKKALCIVLGKRDTFMFLQNNFSPLQEGKKIWQQLTNCHLTGISLAENDRLAYLELQQRDIYQQHKKYLLVAELMPPQPNAVLVDADLKILDAIHKYSYADNPQRQILPGLIYTPPKTSFQPIIQATPLILMVVPPATIILFICIIISLSRKKRQKTAKNEYCPKERTQKLHKKRDLTARPEKCRKADFWLAQLNV